MANEIEITDKDVQELLRINPLAAEQVKVIALNRTLRERDSERRKLEERLAELEQLEKK